MNRRWRTKQILSLAVYGWWGLCKPPLNCKTDTNFSCGKEGCSLKKPEKIVVMKVFVVKLVRGHCIIFIKFSKCTAWGVVWRIYKRERNKIKRHERQNSKKKTDIYGHVNKGTANRHQNKGKNAVSLHERIFTKWLSFLPSLWLVKEWMCVVQSAILSTDYDSNWSVWETLIP